MPRASLTVRPRSASLESLLASPAEALEAEDQRALAQVFGHDLSRIRIHADSQAAELASSFEARAFAFGQDIVFGAGEYQPRSDNGWQTLLHEVAHTAQQRDARVDPNNPVSASFKHEAEARALSAGAATSASLTPSSAVIARLRPGEGEGQDGGSGELNRAALLEQAAHRLAYEHFDADGQWVQQHTVSAEPGTPEYLEQTRAAQLERQQHEFAMTMMRRAGYDVDSSRSVEGENGFGMRSFLPTQDARGTTLSPIVAFRGTEGSVRTEGSQTGTSFDPSDWISDANPEGIGADQYQLNRDLIRAQMALAAQSGNGQLTLSGHSLGGALAQRAASDAPQLVQDVTTFQSPSVTQDVADQFDAGNAARVAQGLAPISSTHFRASGMDIVPWAGDALTRGTVETFDPSGLNTPLDHSAFPLTNRALARGEGLEGLTGEALLGGLSQVQGSDFSSNPSVLQSTDQAATEGFGISEAGRRAAGSFAWDPVRAGLTALGGMAGLASPLPGGMLAGSLGLNHLLPRGNLTAQGMEGAVHGVSSLWNLGTGAVSGAADGLENLAQTTWNATERTAGVVTDAAHGGVAGAWRGLNTAATGAADMLETGGGMARSAIGGYLPEAALDGVAGMWNTARGTVGQASDGLGNAAETTYRGARDLAAEASDTVSGGARNTWRGARHLASDAASAVEGVGTRLGGSVLGAADHLRTHPIAVEAAHLLAATGSGLVDTARGGVSAAQAFGSRAASGLTNAASNTWDAASDTASSAWRWMTDW